MITIATKITLDGYDSYSGADILVTAQLANINDTDKLSKKCYVLGSLQTISISTYQDKSPVRSLGNINAIDYVMGPRSIAGSMVFAVFDRHFAYNIFNDLKEYSGKTTLLTDEIPPLDITINFANEYGKKSKMVIYGLKMVSEGQVMSINDLFTENTYQFVATGLENLVPENGVYPNLSSNKSPDLTITESTTIPFSLPDNKADGNTFDYTENNNSNNNNKKDGFVYVKVNEPLTKEDNGTILVGLNNPNSVDVVLTNQYIEDDINIYTAEMFDNRDEWNIDVPQSVYNISCVDKNTYEVIDNVTNVSTKLNKTINDLKDYPIINNVTSTSIEVEPNNPYHDKVALMSNNMKIQEASINNNSIVFNELSPLEEYKIYSYNDNSTSKLSTCITLSNEDELSNSFKDFVFNNKNLWINDLSIFNFESLQSSMDLIYDIANSSFEFKDELLLYAIKYQNSLKKCFNSENDINTIIVNNALNPKFETTKEYDKLNFYYIQDKKPYYISSKYFDDSDFLLSNINNKIYNVYGVDSNKLKSLKYDSYGFSKTSKENLNKYNKQPIKYNDYNIASYKEDLNIDRELLETIILKDNNFPVYSILLSPNSYYDYKTNIISFGLDYQEYLNRDKEYYLCICNKDDVFQYTPIIKIKIPYDTKTIDLNKYESHIEKDSYYLIYIEDEDFNIISTSEILSTYPNPNELESYKLNDLKEMVKALESYLLQIYSCKDLVESIGLATLSAANISIKNFYNIARQEALNIGIDSFQKNNLDSIIFDITKKEFLDYTENIKMCNIVYENENILFNDKNLNIVVLDYYIDDTYPQKTVYSSNNYIDTKNKNSYCTLIYGIKDFSNKTGFFLKNNITKKIYYYKLTVEENK